MILDIGRSYSTFTSLVNLTRHGSVGLIRLNRPDTLNALSSSLFTELNLKLKECDDDASIGAIILTGDEKAFAAGADIEEMSEKTFSENIRRDFLGHWSEIEKIKKPIIAALGGGCELAMMCDMIFAGTRAKFGQPEIKLGTIPGGGGTQRLTRSVGKSLAMDMILTGRMITAEEAKAAEMLVDETIKVAARISEYSKLAVSMAKEAVNTGLLFERRMFHATFATEGMAAFLQKRSPQFKDN